MSMNINVYGEREIIVAASGKKEMQYTSADVWQTPTTVSYSIINSDDPIKAYLDWVDSRWIPDPEFPDEENWQKEQFEEWVKMCNDNHYTIKFEVW